MSDVAVFAARYRRFLRTLEVADRLCPSWARDFCARWWGRMASPYRLHAPKIVAAMQDGLHLSRAQTLVAWRRWRESHGQFCLSFFGYPRWTAAILDDGVSTADHALLKHAAASGGLLLTYHSHHHNSLPCLLGLAGARISALATAEENSPLSPAIGRYIRMVNRGSALHFGGGDYLFTDDLRALVKETKSIFAAGGMVLSLCDIDGGQRAYDFLGRRLRPPVGAIAVALKMEVPIYVAILYGGYGNKLVLRMRQLDATCGEYGVVQQYLDYLVDVLRTAPAAWQGWDWFGDLPPATTDSERV